MDRIRQYRLGLTAGTLVGVYNFPFLPTSTAVTLSGAEAVQERPLLSREIKTRLSDCGVVHDVGIVQLPVVRALDLQLSSCKYSTQLPQLVLGWVTIFEWANHLGISPSHIGQLSLLSYMGREMSTGQSA